MSVALGVLWRENIDMLNFAGIKYTKKHIYTHLTECLKQEKQTAKRGHGKQDMMCLGGGWRRTSTNTKSERNFTRRNSNASRIKSER